MDSHNLSGQNVSLARAHYLYNAPVTILERRQVHRGDDSKVSRARGGL